MKFFYKQGLKKSNNTVVNDLFFDTIKVKPKMGFDEIRKRAEAKKINLRYFEDNQHVNIDVERYF